MTNLKAKYIEDGYVNVKKSTSQEALDLEAKVQSLIRSYFSDERKWSGLKNDDFHQYCYKCQKEINEFDYQKIFLKENAEAIKEVSGIKNLYHESVIFLRAIRPSKTSLKSDNVGLHRETMFSDAKIQTSKAHNIWIPLSPVTKLNAVKYYRGSHQINDNELSYIEDKSTQAVVRGSYGHKLGMLYKPMTINSKLPRENQRNMDPTMDEFALFSAMTIHGGGVNRSSQLRLSLSMATIDCDAIVDNKKYTAALGKPHYSSLL